MADIRAGDVGTLISFTVKDETGAPVDLSAATTKEIVIIGPNRATASAYPVAFVTDGRDGQVKFSTSAQSFPDAGVWRMQIHVITPAGEWRSTVERIAVEPAL